MGILQEGNTCYMAGVLQILQYHTSFQSLVKAVTDAQLEDIPPVLESLASLFNNNKAYMQHVNSFLQST